MIGSHVGPYRILSELGIGGMGTVYLAEGPDGRRRAVKVVHPHLLGTPGFFKRFLREAEIGQSVDHPNVVRTYDADATVTDGKQVHFIAMEYVEGQTLRELLRELGRVPEELCRHIGHEITAGLEAIHGAGAIHRDLKPENVLITPDHVVKIMDLGIAQLADEMIRLSQTGQFLGSILYAAPEQFTDGGPDVRSDLYSLGLVIYELAAGRHPFAADDATMAIAQQMTEEPRALAELNPQVSPFLEEVVRTLLAKDPEDRFGNASILRALLEEGEDAMWWTERAATIQLQTRRPLRRVRIPRETALYGREGELGRLRALFEQAAAGHGQVILLDGEAGIGKTRLVDEFAATLDADVNFLFGSYPPGGAATASGAFSTAYREHFGDEGSATFMTETPVLVPAFNALLKGEPPPAGSQPLTVDSMQTVFIQATRGLADERPTLLLIDDLHFAPNEGLALFASLASAVASQRVVLFGTMRPGVAEDWQANLERLPHTTRLPLRRLGAKDLMGLLVDAFHSERMAEELGFQIAAKSDGNPFFVFEIIRDLREGGQITQKHDGSWVTTRIIDKIEIPSSVAELIRARIATLSDDEREVLDIASCCGYEFDGALVAEASGVERIPTLRCLARVENDHRLVRAHGRAFVFDHHQVQEVLYEGLPELLREEYHLALGDALEKRDVEGPAVVDVCEHFMKAGRAERAKPYLGAALTHLRAGYLTEPALELIDRALAAPGLYAGVDRARLLLDKAERLSLVGRREEEAAAVDEALELADAGDDMHLRGKVRIARASRLGNTSRFEEGYAVTLAAKALAEEAGLRDIEATAYEFLATIDHALGRLGAAEEYFTKALALHRELGDKRGEVNVLGGQGGMLSDAGRHEEARALHEQALAIARENGDRDGVAIATGNLGNVCFSLGRLADALAHYESCNEAFTEIGSRRGRANTIANLAEMYMMLGDPARARDNCERAISMAEDVQYGFLAAWARLTLAEIALREGEKEEAQARLDDALARLRAIPAPPYVANALILQAELLGLTEEARAPLKEAVVVAPPGSKVIALAMLARLPGGDTQAAIDAYAATELDYDDRAHAARHLWKATGDESYRAAAEAAITQLCDHAPERYRESLARRYGL